MLVFLEEILGVKLIVKVGRKLVSLFSVGVREERSK
jgi:hypothetical protein